MLSSCCFIIHCKLIEI